MVYFRKLVGLFLDKTVQNYHLTRDIIGPRFFQHARGDFLEGMKRRDKSRMDHAWSDIQEVLPLMHIKIRLRMRLVGPLVGLLYHTPFKGLTRGLLSFGTHGSRKKQPAR